MEVSQEFLKYAFAACLTISVILITIVFMWRDMEQPHVDQEEQKQLDSEHKKAVEEAAAIMTQRATQRAVQEQTRRRFAELDGEFVSTDTSERPSKSSLDGIPEPISVDRLPKKIVRDPKIIEYEKLMGEKAELAFLELAKVANDDSISEDTQLAILKNIHDLFSEAETKYKHNRAGLVGVQAVLCNILLKHSGFDLATKMKEKGSKSVGDQAQRFIEKVAPMVWCS